MSTPETSSIILRIFKIFMLITMSSQPLLLTINYLNHIFQKETQEPINFTYMYFIDKLFFLAAIMFVIFLINKFRKLIFAFVINIVIAFFFLEYLSITRPKFMGYIIFLIILSFNKSLSLISGVKLATCYVTNTLILVYIIIRTIVFKFQDPTFPLFYSIVLIIDYIMTEIPIFCLFYNYSKFTTHRENIILDFRTIVNLIPNPIIIYDTELNSIKLTNQVAHTKFNECAMIEIIAAALQNPIPSIEIKFSLKDFTYSITTCHFEATSLEKKSIIISVVDITGIASQERKAANEDAMWLFINAANHQIRTPLSGIESSLALLQEALDNNDMQSLSTNLEIAVLSVLSLRHLIDDTFLFCEEKENKIVIQNEMFTMSEITTYLKQVFTFETYGKNLKLTLVEHEYPLYLVGDKKHILHIIYTFMANAFKYTLAGEIVFSYQVECKDQGSQLKIKISDTGIGIDKDELQSIFNAFENTNHKKSEEKVSTGISLHIARKLSVLMGGEIALKSEKGKGSTFYITIPITVTKIEKKLNSLKSSELVYSPTHSNSMNKTPYVLIVDDNTTNLFVLSRMLSKISVTYDIAHNGEEAVSLFKDGKHKLVLMDINMPIMNGFEASKKIKEIRKERNQISAVVAVSAQDKPIQEDILADCDIVKWVVKPVSVDVLKELLKENGIVYKHNK